MNWQSPRPVQLPVLHFSKVIRMMSLRAQLGNERSDVALAGGEIDEANAEGAWHSHGADRAGQGGCLELVIPVFRQISMP